MSKKNIIPIFVPHLGCPNDCVFCNQNKITASSTNITSDDVRSIIEEYLSYFKDKNNIEVAFYGGSFTAIEICIQLELLSVAKEYKENNIIKEIRLSTRPDCIDIKRLEILKHYLVDTIELGVQSLDEDVLNLSNRGHDDKCVYNAVKLIKKYGFNLGLQQMIGLPGDSLEASLYTTREFIKLNPDFVRIYPTLVIKDTELEKSLYNGSYKPLSIEDAVRITKELLKLYILNGIYVIRIGLQPTENIQMGKDVIAGPFHPAIRQIVEGEILFDVLKNFFNDKEITNYELEIHSSNKNVSNLAGQKSFLKNKIINEFKIKNLKLFGENISDDVLILKYRLNEKNFENEIQIKDYMIWR
ncbi:MULTISPECIES: elongator complex protein 3 [Peptoniphilus]|uniref:elongator complex protein 3 n=1 Tax=Peptoniphilus TaxID=162289 RepID=UPI0001DA9BB2|nr:MULTISPECIES: radical SAM protein [Peptoniphilus]EFI42356.1 radical SAM domain protein [Peptoniphilus sp. oral taxon 386 str. F0131]